MQHRTLELPRPSSPLARLPAAMALLWVTGCATLAPGAAGAHAADPWEGLNRRVHAFNQVVDEQVAAPVASAWRDKVPAPVRSGVSNVFNNFSDISSTANHLLQGKPLSGLEMGLRVLANSTVGLAGLLDVASGIGLERRPEDYGQTLAVWGLPSGPFLVLPFFGPATLRDAMVLPAELVIGPNLFIDSGTTRALVTAVNLVDTRANLLGVTALLDAMALDRYSFVRDAYLARRLNQIHDGAPPAEGSADDRDAPAAKPR